MFKFGLQLERSRGCDLSVSLSSGLAGIGDHPILAMLDTSTSRWKYLRVDLPPEGLKSLSGNSFLRLDTLIVRICARRNSPTRNMKFNGDSKHRTGSAAISVPSVINLNLHETSKSPGAIYRLLASVSFPSATLLNMSFPLTFNVSPDQNVRALLEFLTVAGNLVDLRLYMEAVPDSLLTDLTVSQSHRILPKLRTLTLQLFTSSAGVSTFTPTLLFRMLRSHYVKEHGDVISDGTADSSGISTVGTGSLKELRLKAWRKLNFANLEDQQGWNAICEEIKVVYG
ncbi:hypothetical protein ARMSODRAFT_1009897 [Armillaria solidipes]|uniref:F-box domain-containing protein n=1 Tax=Armillaria solidipes TaxID=1076256 RepID=A0A2H3B5E4_9AGAR|nr:hypothetical protein ARMSODRAFT_1009897 [Armillaria solidipes]